MKPELAVSYLRVSTRAQGESGLGIEAQRAAVERYMREHDLELVPGGEYLEIESGTKSSRPILRKAIARAEGTRALLLIARLDRLTRSNKFLCELLDSPELRFAAVDLPEADRMLLQLLSVVAEREAAATSERTRAAMAAAKARGVVFGRPWQLTRDDARRGARLGHITTRGKRDRTIARVSERIRELKVQGASYRSIAAILNDERYVTANRKRWGARGVWRAWQRMESERKFA